jgi:multiple sugar transport system permease protein
LSNNKKPLEDDKRTFDKAKFGLFLILPAQIALLFIVIFPLLTSIYLSLTKWSPLTGRGTLWYQAYQFWTWFSNYVRIVTDSDFLLSLFRTFLIVVVVVPVEFVLGLGLAFLFLDKFPGKKFLHSILLMPMMIVPAVAGFIFYMLFQSVGPINGILSRILFRDITTTWLTGGLTAMICIMLADIWQWTPLMFLILLSGLMALPEDQMHAAEILGASRWQRFRMVTLPLLKPVIVIALIIRGMEAIKIFDAIWLMTKGGPGTATETISVYLTKQLKYLHWSWVATAGVIVLILISIASIYALRPIKEQEKQAV